MIAVETEITGGPIVKGSVLFVALIEVHITLAANTSTRKLQRLILKVVECASPTVVLVKNAVIWSPPSVGVLNAVQGRTTVVRTAPVCAFRVCTTPSEPHVFVEACRAANTIALLSPDTTTGVGNMQGNDHTTCPAAASIASNPASVDANTRPCVMTLNDRGK